MEHLSEPLISAIFGVVGTLVGAVISWVASARIYKSQLKDSLLTSAYSMIVQAQIAYSDFLSIKRHIDDSISEACKQNPSDDGQLWARVIPIAGLPDPWKLDSKDASFLARAREYELLKDTITLAMKHSALVGGMAQYNALRIELSRELHPEEEGGQMFGASLDRQEYLRLLPRMVELNSLITSLIEGLNEDIAFAQSVLKRLGPAGKRFFDDCKFPSLETTAS